MTAYPGIRIDFFYLLYKDVRGRAMKFCVKFWGEKVKFLTKKQGAGRPLFEQITRYRRLTLKVDQLCQHAV